MINARMTVTQALRHALKLNRQVLNHSSVVTNSLKPICTLESYQFILLVQALSVKPPKMFSPLFTTVIVGPLLSHLE